MNFLKKIMVLLFLLKVSFAANETLEKILGSFESLFPFSDSDKQTRTLVIQLVKEYVAKDLPMSRAVEILGSSVAAKYSIIDMINV